jgi:hypothetical protein
VVVLKSAAAVVEAEFRCCTHMSHAAVQNILQELKRIEALGGEVDDSS